MLLSLDSATRAKITVKYAEVYQAAWDEEPISYRKDNTARRHANIWLREFVRKYARVSQGYTEKPLKALPENQPNLRRQDDRSGLRQYGKGCVFWLWDH